MRVRVSCSQRAICSTTGPRLSPSHSEKSSKAPESSRATPRAKPRLECFRRTIRSKNQRILCEPDFFDESSLRYAVADCAAHYHSERNHQGLQNKILRPKIAEFPQTGAIHSRQPLGGLLRYYYRDPA